MKRKFLYLFLAFLLPGCIFVFLKYFARNEFNVPSLYQTEAPPAVACGKVNLPYTVGDTVISSLAFQQDSLAAIVFGSLTADGQGQLKRTQEEIADDAVKTIRIEKTDAKTEAWRTCSFFLKEPFNTVLVDRKGVIRGQYDMNDRKEVDRLLTEITIILKKY